MNIERKDWGAMPGHGNVELFTLSHGSMSVSITNYGATLVSLKVPGKLGAEEVLLGYDSLNSYLHDPCYFGCVVGRVANRISNAHFELDGTVYGLDRNHGKHHLHGGSSGFNSRLWEAEEGISSEGPYLALEYLSPDGEQGFPGTLQSTVIYLLTECGLRIDFVAESDAPTVVNLTNHAYFNLAGPHGDCLDHEILLHASRCLETDAELIPSGTLLPVAGTPLDFTKPQDMGARIHERNPLLEHAGGYDHFFVADRDTSDLKLLARVREPLSGRGMEMHSTYPGFQFYTGNFISEGLAGRAGETYGPRSGFCLEAQEYPDAPNRPEFPSVVLWSGTTLKHRTEYRFFVE